jgi:hypothetical protein
MAVGLLSLALLAGTAQAAAPKATTEEATEITTTSAVLHATIETGGEWDYYGFEYGTTEESGIGSEGKLIPKGTFGPVHVEAKVTGLQPNTKYYFRIGATNGAGEATLGKYLTFTTLRKRGLSVSNTTKQFMAREYPATITGSSLEPFSLLIGNEVEASCGEGQYSASMSGDSSSLLLGAAYSKCSFLGEEATVEMHSCHWVDAASASGTLLTLAVSCGVEGDSISIATNACTLKIHPQSAVTSGYWTNEGEPEGGTVAVRNWREVTFSRSGPLCFLVRKANGQLTLSAKLGQS